jgi:hypothetical protein
VQFPLLPLLGFVGATRTPLLGSLIRQTGSCALPPPLPASLLYRLHRMSTFVPSTALVKDIVKEVSLAGRFYTVKKLKRFSRPQPGEFSQ